MGKLQDQSNEYLLTFAHLLSPSPSLYIQFSMSYSRLNCRHDHLTSSVLLTERTLSYATTIWLSRPRNEKLLGWGPSIAVEWRLAMHNVLDSISSTIKNATVVDMIWYYSLHIFCNQILSTVPMLSFRAFRLPVWNPGSLAVFTCIEISAYEDSD